MLIYAVADIHGKTEKIEQVESNIDLYKPDLVVIAGDITNYFHAEKIIKRLSRIQVPLLVIRGNSDLQSVEKIVGSFPGIHSLDKKFFCFENRWFTGINGTIPLPFYSIICLREKEKLKKMKKFVTHDSIVVAHPPCRGTLDKVGKRFHAGSKHLKDFIIKLQPAMLLCGHIHEDAGFKYIGRTMVVNCAMNRECSGAVIEYSQENEPDVKMICK
ncbi:MAG: metallophosphoesterase [Thermodesulfobacteriota bacterium]|nr:metallophosphoesterase [Thermodesulfobacteriota bacterium]